MWDEFEDWGPCSKSCGTGYKTRSRSVLTPLSKGGKECEGESAETNACNTHACPVDCTWDSFGEWSSCTKSCGGGEKTRKRSILTPASDGGQDCKGPAIEKDWCNTNACPIDCEWGRFGEWSVCSKSCGNGETIRTRLVQTLALNGGLECQGDAIQRDICNAHACPTVLCNEGPCPGQYVLSKIFYALEYCHEF